MFKQFIGKKVIIRAARAGVFFGTLAEIEGENALIQNCRRLWYWKGAASLSQLANEGVKKPQNCKFSVVIPTLGVRGVIEVIPASNEAIECIEKVSVWRI